MILEPNGITFGLPKSLIVPIGAKSKASIQRYVGVIESNFDDDSAFLVSFCPLEKPDQSEVWQHHRSALLNHALQLWVNVNYKNYRQLYFTIFNEMVEDKKSVIDHIMNRKLARSLGYNFVRLLHISRSSNSSGGRGGETFANISLSVGLSINPDISSNEIVYADPMDLLKMLNINVGGFGLDVVRDNHHLFYGRRNTDLTSG